ncbi:OLC1v1000208C3 [Oldenlandia corymbosa var. corymbosa]|nr:OLC1v1000208C3 [Oldenlandia corymbosa var. corymbosa]
MAEIPSELVPPTGTVHRKDFGRDFLFGGSTSAFQIEGGVERDGRGKSIFDTFVEERGLYGEYGPDAVNHREFYEIDVEHMRDIGFNSYRFSISWSRILPTGKKESRNQDGINFYKDLVKKIKAAGMEPMATLLHFDPPQDLENAYFTFLKPEIVDDFCDYAEICFQEFGNDIKYWTTINEPWYVSYGGYIRAEIPPGYQADKDYDTIQKEIDTKSGKSYPGDNQGSICPPFQCSNISSSSSSSDPAAKEFSPKDDSTLPPREQWPYIAGYYQLLAHAKAVKLYREKYEGSKGGKIGLNLVAQWYLPWEDTQENIDAAKRAMDFMLGWFMDPLYKGDYPENMHKYVTKGFLPKLDKDLVQGTYDFVSLNYYTSLYVADFPNEGGDFVLDRRVNFFDRNPAGELIGDEQGHGGWINKYPEGLLNVLVYLKENYGDPEIYIHENGFDDPNLPLADRDALYDQKRLWYHHDHLLAVKDAIR